MLELKVFRLLCGVDGLLSRCQPCTYTCKMARGLSNRFYMCCTSLPGMMPITEGLGIEGQHTASAPHLQSTRPPAGSFHLCGVREHFQIVQRIGASFDTF